MRPLNASAFARIRVRLLSDPGPASIDPEPATDHIARDLDGWSYRSVQHHYVTLPVGEGEYVYLTDMAQVDKPGLIHKALIEWGTNFTNNIDH